MFGRVMDRVRVALGRPSDWERRSKAAWMQAIQLVSDARGRDELLDPTASHGEPAVVHKPTGWLLTFPPRDRRSRLGWLRTEAGRFTLKADAVRSGVLLETFIAEPGPLSLGEEFELRVRTALAAGPDVVILERTPPGEEGSDEAQRPGVLGFAFSRNGAPQAARLLMAGVAGHVVEVAYDTPARLSQAAKALADAAFASGLAHARDPQLGELDLDELGELDPHGYAEALRGFGMSEAEVVQALKEQAITQP